MLDDEKGESSSVPEDGQSTKDARKSLDEAGDTQAHSRTGRPNSEQAEAVSKANASREEDARRLLAERYERAGAFSALKDTSFQLKGPAISTSLQTFITDTARHVHEVMQVPIALGQQMADMTAAFKVISEEFRSAFAVAKEMRTAFNVADEFRSAFALAEEMRAAFDVTKEMRSALEASAKVRSSLDAALANGGLSIAAIGRLSFDTDVQRALAPLASAFASNSRQSEGHISLGLDHSSASSLGVGTGLNLGLAIMALSQVDADAVSAKHPDFGAYLSVVSEELESVRSVQPNDDSETLSVLSSIAASLKTIEGATLATEAGVQQLVDSGSKSDQLAIRLAVLEILIPIIFTIVFYLITRPMPEVSQPDTHSPTTSEDELDLDALANALLGQVLQSGTWSERTLVRRAPLRIEPYGEARPLCRLEEGTQVLELGRTGRWLRVLANQDRQGTRLGWIYEHHLRRPP